VVRAAIGDNSDIRFLVDGIMSLRSSGGSAEKGTGHFLGQRLSAIAVLILGLWFVYSLLAMPGFSHGEALAFIGSPLNCVLLLLFVVTTAYHSNLGVQVVIEDYVHGHGLNRASLIFSRLAHTLVAGAAVYATIKIGLGA
jgi:succinate dehydrogenase / fumarate reductase membrane anchor subunit